jgi:hypothetical protein
LTKAALTNDTKGQQATNSSGEPSAASAGFHNRPATRAGPYEKILHVFIRNFILIFLFSIEGGRNLLDSSFSLSGKLEFRMKIEMSNKIF